MEPEQYSSSNSSSSTELFPASKAPPPFVSSPTSSWASFSSSSPVGKKKRRTGRKKFRETRHPVYRGVRERNGGKWVCEVREPQNKNRIWLGTYTTPEMAARAHDVAAIALRGKAAPLNFPDSAWVLPCATSTAAEDIRCAAIRAADMFRTPTSPFACTTESVLLSSSRPCVVESELRPAAVKESEERREEGIFLRRGPAPSTQTTAAAAAAAAAVAFLDEEAVFNMPALLDSMAEGMLLTPPSLNGGFDWDDVDDHVDISLWRY